MEEKKNVLRIRKGNRYKCIKDVILHNGEVAYIKGKTYISYKDNCLTNELNNENYTWDDSCIDDYFELYCEEKKNVFVYIRGVEDKGQEVIDTLVKLDGTNHLGLNGTNPNRLYYIASSGTIGYTEKDCSRNSTWVKNHYTEIFLPKQKLKDKQLVWCWDYGDVAQRHLCFYDAQYKCTFRHCGLRNSFKYGNYVPFEGEYPEWAKEAIKLLED